MKKIVNFIQFVRGVEPRNPKLDLIKPVVEQVALLQKYNFRGTMLLQYDAMLRPEFQKIAMDTATFQETGLWLEIVQQLAESAGIVWRGRQGYSWDWHSHCGTLVGYTPDERRRLLDAALKKFREIFGYLPKAVGAWVLDSVSLAHLRDVYGITAACICKEQWGTDGYTLWGGNQVVYYPSRKNGLSPAQSRAQQIDVPVFRMLGSDPVYQYDIFLDKDEKTDVITLEPGSGIFGGTGGGEYPGWVDWYLKEIFEENRGISVTYTQTGQENSFGWDAIKRGMPYQSKKIADMRDRGDVEVLTLSETGEWFASKYGSTPPSVQAALSDWKQKGHKSVWYNSARYRINLFIEEGEACIRDCYLFDENYPERYLSDVCKDNACMFDNLPIWDGLRRNKDGKTAKLIFADTKGRPLRTDGTEYTETQDSVKVSLSFPQGKITAEFTLENVRLISSGLDFSLLGYADADKIDTSPQADGTKRIYFTYRGYNYGLLVSSGVFSGKEIRSENGEIILSFFSGTV